MEMLGAGDPERIGAYRLLARLGAGGMGRVYLARSDRGRTVAVKLVRAELAEREEFRARFRQEVRAARRVGGDWTAPVLDADTEAAVPWVATGYVAGPSLERVVGRDHGALPERTVRILAAGLARALCDIHGAGLVHRDLKPSNVLITIDGPRVIDFGIARALESADDSGLTRAGAVVGSPGFMAPEQVRGERVTAAVDVFSLGSVLAYASTGRLPFGDGAGGAHALMYRIAQDEPDLTDVPEGLSGLIGACLRKDAAARPSLDDVLREVAAGHATLAGGRTRDPWLPAALVAQLGRHAAGLLDVEDPGPRADQLPTVVTGPGAPPPAVAPSPPGAGAPVPSAPGAAGPDSAAPVPSALGVAGPTPSGPGAAGPGAAGPRAAGPGSAAPGSGAPVPGAPDVVAPESGGSAASAPGAAVPGSAGPGPGVPVASAPGAAVPGPAWPAPPVPGAAPGPVPGALPPGVAAPGGAAPDPSVPAAALGSAAPWAPAPGSAVPGPPGWGTAAPGAHPPAAYAPGPYGSVPGLTVVDGTPPPDRDRNGGGARTAVIVAAATLAVALVAGGAVYGLMRGDDHRSQGDRGTGTSASDSASRSPSPSASRTAPVPAETGEATPPPGEGAVPETLLGDWSAVIENASGSNPRHMTLSQGEVGDPVLRLVAEGPLAGTSSSYRCVFEADLVEATGDGRGLRLGPSRVVDGAPLSSCSPGEASTLTLTADGSLNRSMTTGDTLTYHR
ncbi:serine/threonine-protein kinase [Streptomyces abyssomicinicus]|uniref:serine/threonine-protein kinase n=1 Tax=Streptomyces abyssomicinicus TaxID=574929 RepID=UPI001250660F|nr:serine/threonine-protein kinase [Streptomyces abyssomicinicus]